MSSILMREGFKSMMEKNNKCLLELSGNLGTRINDKQRKDIVNIIRDNCMMLNEVIEYL